MSSPFHSLKKNKVPLFPGHMSGNRPIPFRHPDYSEDESRLLAEITTNMIQEKSKKRSPLIGLAPIGSSQSPTQLRGGDPDGDEDDTLPPSDSDLMRLMMNRIAQLEQRTQTQDSEIRAKDRQIKILEDRLRIAEKARRETGSSNTKELETHCLLLQQQVHEMETFLAEYGMVWVGDTSNDNSDVYIDRGVDDDDDDDEENNNLTETSVRSESPGNSIASSDPFGIWRQDTSLAGVSSTSSTSLLTIDFNLLVENLKDLNVLAGAGVAQIKKTSDGARFEMPEPVQLTIYANGILMFDGPFRPYTDPTTRQCVQDILDGYFPTELQSRYPDGVPFNITDLRNTHFQPRHLPLAFAGEGQALGGEKKPSRLIPTNFQDPTKKIPLPTIGGRSSQTALEGDDSPRTTSRSQVPAMTSTQFLTKLPKSVIKDGKVIDVRDSVERTLNGSDDKGDKPKVTLVKTAVTKEMSDSVIASTDFSAPLERPKSYKGHSDVTTLRVVTENGNHTYILKMKFKETVGDLRTYLDQQRRPTVPYDIVSTFPHKVHSNNTMTLEDSGLTPNAVLHIKPCKQ